MTRPEVLPIYAGVSFGCRETMLSTMTYQEHTAHVEHECHHGVEQQDAVSRPRSIGKVKLVPLGRTRNEDVHHSANRGIVVQADQRIHLLPIARKQHLDHDEAHSLKHNAADLEQEPNHAEVDLAQASQRHAGDNDADGGEPVHRRLLHAPDPRSEQDGDGRGRLEHLDEGDAQVQVDHVAAHQASAVEQADGHDGAQVHPPRHLDLLTAIEKGRGARENLRRGSCKDKMPTCQDRS